MIEIIQEYWRNYLYTDGYRFTGLAITLWLLVVSIGLGFCLSIPLAVARVSTSGAPTPWRISKMEWTLRSVSDSHGSRPSLRAS